MGEIRDKPSAMKEMEDIAGDVKNLEFVDSYNALTSILAQLENNLLSSIEGGFNTFCMLFFFSIYHFSNHLASPFE